MPAAQIQIEGLRETRRAFNKYGAQDWKPFIKGAFAPIGEHVAQIARGISGPKNAGSVALGSIRGKATTTGASVEAYKGIPWGPGHEFGAIRYRQFPPKVPKGYRLFPTVEVERGWIADRIMQELEQALDRDFSG